MSDTAVSVETPERGDDKRSTLISKAALLMADKGFHQTTMRDVSRATGLSLAGLYHYFESKDDLLFQLQQRTFASLAAEQERVAGQSDDVEQRLRDLIHNHLAFYTHHFAELKVCIFELQSLQGDAAEQIQVLWRRYFKIMASAVSELLAARGLPVEGEAVRHQVLFIFGALNWIFMWFDPGRDAPVARLAEELCALVLDGLGRAAAV